MHLNVEGKKVTIYIDLDGVMVDLAKGLSLLEGYDDPVLWFMHSQEAHGALSFSNVIKKHIDDDVFVNLPPMPYFEEMKKLIYIMKNKGYNVKVLSSCMDTSFSDKIKEQKIKWVSNHLNGYINRDDIHIVRGSSLKIDYIKDENTYLIDDYVKTQKQFIESGLGDQFIFYKSFYGSLSQLKNKEII